MDTSTNGSSTNGSSASGSSTARAARRALVLAAVWLGLAAAYVLFVGSLSLNEALAGSASASLAAAWWALVARRGGRRFPADRGAVRLGLGALATLPARTLRTGLDLLGAVLRGPGRGSARRAPESATGWARAEGPAAPTLRAVGLLAASLAPDSYVLRLAPDGAVTEHALRGAGHDGAGG